MGKTSHKEILLNLVINYYRLIIVPLSSYIEMFHGSPRLEPWKRESNTRRSAFYDDNKSRLKKISRIPFFLWFEKENLFEKSFWINLFVWKNRFRQILFQKTCFTKSCFEKSVLKNPLPYQIEIVQQMYPRYFLFKTY